MEETPDHDDTRLLADDRLTVSGLMFETQAGLRNEFEGDFAQHSVTASAVEVLIRLGRSPDHRLRMTELANQSTLSNSGLTRVVDRLVADGCIQRLQDGGDRRVFWAVLTPQGLQRVLAILPGHLTTIEACITSVLDPQELDVLVSALRKIRSVVKPGADPAAVLAELP